MAELAWEPELVQNRAEQEPTCNGGNNESLMSQEDKAAELYGSLKESVRGLRFGKLTEHVVQGYFARFLGAEPVGFSEGQFDLVV